MRDSIQSYQERTGKPKKSAEKAEGYGSFPSLTGPSTRSNISPSPDRSTVKRADEVNQQAESYGP